MNMQDNQLDDLFRSKLSGMEVEPDAHVWNNIANELGSPKKKSLAPVLRMAASVILVLAAGTWFAVWQNKDQHNKPVVNSQMVKIGKKENAVKSNIAPMAHDTHSSELLPQQNNLPVNRVASNRTVAKSVRKLNMPTATAQKTEVVVNEPVIAQPEQELVAVTVPMKTQPVLPEMPLTVKTIDVEPVSTKSVNSVAAASVTANQPIKKVTKKRGINSFGDLINAVVAKVDKREDKIIEFTDTDGDEATITGVNLGIVKLKKEK